MEKVKLKKHKKQDLFFFDKQQSQHKKERKDSQSLTDTKTKLYYIIEKLY